MADSWAGCRGAERGAVKRVAEGLQYCTFSKSEYVCYLGLQLLIAYLMVNYGETQILVRNIEEH